MKEIVLNIPNRLIRYKVFGTDRVEAMSTIVLKVKVKAFVCHVKQASYKRLKGSVKQFENWVLEVVLEIFEKTSAFTEPLVFLFKYDRFEGQKKRL